MNDRHMLHVFAKYTLMSVGGMLANSCYILADTFFVAQGLGTQGLAALNLAIPVYNFVYGAGLLLGMGGATRYAVCKSRGDARGADEAFGYALGMAAVCSAVGMLLGVFASGRLTALLGASGDVAGMTQTYLQVMLLFSPAFIVNGVLVCFVRNDGNPRLAMLSTVIGSFSNIVLDYVFIFPLGMGMFGAIFATGLSPVLGILVLLPHWFSPRRGSPCFTEKPAKKAVTPAGHTAAGVTQSKRAGTARRQPFTSDKSKSSGTSRERSAVSSAAVRRAADKMASSSLLRARRPLPACRARASCTALK